MWQYILPISLRISHRLSPDGGLQEVHGRIDVARISQMTWRDSQAATTDSITGIAENLRPGSRIIWNLSVVLTILGVAIEHHALDLFLLLSRKSSDCGGDEGGALTDLEC